MFKLNLPKVYSMSIEQKRNLDALFKIFIAIAVAFFGWLGNRTVQQFDAVRSAIELIQLNNQRMQTDIEWLKDELKRKQ